MTVSVLIPAGGNPDPWRARALLHIVRHYQTHHPDWMIHIGRCDPPATWSKGAAVADAFAQTTADTLVLADADSFVDPVHLEEAVAAVPSTGWAMPHYMVYRLSQDATEAVYAGAPPRHDSLQRGGYRGVNGGGIVAISRDAYLEVDGIDPRFENWGGEDIAFSIALVALIGKPARRGGDLWHLYHPHPAPDLRGNPPEEALVARYKEARNHPSRIRDIIAERKPSR